MTDTSINGAPGAVTGIVFPAVSVVATLNVTGFDPAPPTVWFVETVNAPEQKPDDTLTAIVPTFASSETAKWFVPPCTTFSEATCCESRWPAHELEHVVCVASHEEIVVESMPIGIKNVAVHS